MRGSWISILVIAALAGFAGLTMTAPFGNGSLIANLCHYNELFAHAWDEVGFGDSLGVPMMDALGERVAEREPYAHMAPAGWWPMYAGRQFIDDRTIAYKIFPTLFGILGALLIWRLVLQHVSRGWAAAFVALWIGIPVVQLYLALPGLESSSLFFSAAFVTLWERWREYPTRTRLVIAYAAFLVGTQVAWPFYFIAPGLWLAELCRPAAERRWRPLLSLFLVGVLGFLLVVTHLALGVGDLRLVIDDLTRTVGNVGGRPFAAPDNSISETPFIETLLPMSRTWLGSWTVSAVAATVLVLALVPRWRRDPVTRLAVTFLGPGVLAVAVFNGRSATHGYYYFLMGTATALLLLQGARVIAAALRRPLGPRIATALAVAAVATVTAQGLVEIWPIKQASEREGLLETAKKTDDQVAKDCWILCHAVAYHDVGIYSRRRWIPHWPGRDRVEEFLADPEPRRHGFRKLLIILDRQTRDAYPDYVAWLESQVGRPGVHRMERKDPDVLMFML